MQVSIEKTGDLGRKLTVAVPSDDIDGKVSGRLSEMRGQVRLKGFRPGKVPMNVMRQRFGQQIREEVTQQIMQSSLQDAISEQNLRVAGVSRLAPEPGGDTESSDFRFVAELEVFPELPEIDTSTLTIEQPVVSIEDEDVDQMLMTLREQRRTWSNETRAAENGDRVQLEFAAQLGDQRIPEDGFR
ncbi:MAG: trigger factor, partial [Pseudomonadota bacterium]